VGASQGSDAPWGTGGGPQLSLSIEKTSPSLLICARSRSAPPVLAVGMPGAMLTHPLRVPRVPLVLAIMTAHCKVRALA
jgi:hypothetical protein